MFEVVIQRTGLSVAIAGEQAFQCGTQDPFNCNDGGDPGHTADFNGDSYLSSAGLWNLDLGIDIPFPGFERSVGLMNGENMFPDFLSRDQWNIPM